MAFQKFKGATDLTNAREAVDEMRQVISGATISAKDFVATYAQMAGIKDPAVIRRLTESLDENALAAKRAKEAQLELQKAVASYQAKVSSYKTGSQIFNGLIGGVGSAAMGIRSLQTTPYRQVDNADRFKHRSSRPARFCMFDHSRYSRRDRNLLLEKKSQGRVERFNSDTRN